MTTSKRIAESITLDREKGDIWIDGQRLPWHVREDVGITSMSKGDLPSVELSILCDNVHVIESLDDDIKWIQTLGARQMQGALDDFLVAELNRRTLSGVLAFITHTPFPDIRHRLGSAPQRLDTHKDQQDGS